MTAPKKRYVLACIVAVSAETVVYAETEEEALCMAADRSVELTGYGDGPEDCWIVESADGEPQNVRIERIGK